MVGVEDVSKRPLPCSRKSDYSGALYFRVQLMETYSYIHKYSSYCRILQHYRSLLHNYCECTTPDWSMWTSRHSTISSRIFKITLVDENYILFAPNLTFSRSLQSIAALYFAQYLALSFLSRHAWLFVGETRPSGSKCWRLAKHLWKPLQGCANSRWVSKLQKYSFVLPYSHWTHKH